MAINSIGSSTSLLGQSIANIKNQLNTLQVQLATGEKSTTYSGMGTGEGFAIAARAQLANITGYQNTITNVGTTISVENTALQALATSSSNVETAANSGSQTVNSNGQTAGQVTATSQLSSMLSILNTQAGNGYVFSGAATNTPSVATADAILNGSGAQAGLSQVISERQAADLGSGERISLVVRAEAAVLFRNGNAEQAGAMQIPVILGRKFRLAIIGRGAAGEHPLAELACARDDGGLFIVQPEGGGIEDRRIRIDLVDISHALAGLHRHAVTRVAATWALRKESSAPLKVLGRSRLTRWPTPSSST